MSTRLECLTTTVGPYHVASPIACVRGVREGVEVVPLPRTPDHVLGAVDMWGRWMGLADLRSVFGLGTASKETDQAVRSVNAQAEAHRSWVEDLHNTARTGQVPTRCNDWCDLAEWTDALGQTNPRIRILLEQLRLDHDALHRAVDGTSTHDPEQAAKALATTRRRDLPRLEVSLERLQTMLGFARRNIAIAVQTHSYEVAVRVDMVQRVEPVDRVNDPKQEVVKTMSGEHALLLDVASVFNLAPTSRDGEPTSQPT